VKVLPGNTVEFPHVALRLIPEILNAVYVVRIVREHLAVVDSVVFEFGHVQHVVAVKTVRIDDAVREYLLLHYRHQRG